MNQKTPRDVVVIGAGLAGLVAANELAFAGRSVTLVNKGIGGIQLGQGTIDLYGYSPKLVNDPCEAIETATSSVVNPDLSHPYQPFDAQYAAEAVKRIKELVGEDLLVGDGKTNYRLPTAVGALRPTALAQPSMIAGQPRIGKQYVIVGFSRLKDFYPHLVAENLGRQVTEDGQAIQARAVQIDIEVRSGEYDTSGLNFARAFDHEEFRQKVVDHLRPLLQKGEIVGFPAVLGIKDIAAWDKLASSLGHEIFEIPLPPPSVPGMRLNERLLSKLKSSARIINGVGVIGFSSTEGKIQSVTVNSAGHPQVISAQEFILAAGGFESGALQMDSYGEVKETIFGLPLAGISEQPFHEDYWGKEQPLFHVGVQVDQNMRPLDMEGQLFYSNLCAVGGVQAGATRWREKNGDGIALLTALKAVETILGADHE